MFGYAGGLFALEVFRCCLEVRNCFWFALAHLQLQRSYNLIAYGLWKSNVLYVNSLNFVWITNEVQPSGLMEL
ncbi:Hypothetical predicted protein [Olea europaea subsp. europaea]|uniref:Uncharacterized protein n=1 Tax=Olea europaea subsp. europaea TaxID=158383 RepID=A0A8S0R6X2_OLEEU|nr:Hypothetical predicted protein [Olea europaea subsp. europaea]